jgi:beta-glucosidase-like glycosyl hydrolase
MSVILDWYSATIGRRLGLFEEDDNEAAVPTFDMAVVDSAEHRAVALATARQGVILLQNGDGSGGAKVKLPLSKAKYETLAMIGPNANASMNLLSGYHGSPPFLVSPLQAMRKKWYDRRCPRSSLSLCFHSKLHLKIDHQKIDSVSHRKQLPIIHSIFSITIDWFLLVGILQGRR